MPARRFSPPWSTEVTPNCFIVRDANGQALSYIYYESELGRRSAALLSEDEARRIAANIAKLPGAGYGAANKAVSTIDAIKTFFVRYRAETGSPARTAAKRSNVDSKTQTTLDHNRGRGGKKSSSPSIRYDVIASRPALDVSQRCHVSASPYFTSGHLAGLMMMLP
jgi:hypothetical protein